MRYPALASLACVAVLLAAPAAEAQRPETVQVRIEKVKIGFQSMAQEDLQGTLQGTFKPGLWAPIHVTLVVSPDGTITLPVRLDGFVEGEIRVESDDSDDLPNVYTEFFRFRYDRQAPRQPVHRMAYVKPSAVRPKIKVTVQARSAQAPEGRAENPTGLQMNEHLYLTVGSRVRDLHNAMIALSAKPEDKNPAPRHAAYEDDVHRLPEKWIGYDGVDLVILTTNQKNFLDDLLKMENRSRVEALAEWVRRGGRLVVSVSWKNQKRVSDLLKAASAWQPPLPDVLPDDAQEPITRLFAIQDWVEKRTRVRPKPFKFEAPKNEAAKGDVDAAVLLALEGHLAGGHALVTQALAHQALLAVRASGVAEIVLEAERQKKLPRVARFHPRHDVEVEVKEGTLPLLVRMPYGLGSVALLAFDVGSAPFDTWASKVDFWKAVVDRFAPRLAVRPGPEAQNLNPRGDGWVGQDLTTHLHQELDRFDTPPISFGWVALFILLYIVVVGPLDYLLLKKVFKRLELTWITFPTVVLTISLAAYFTAYAVKGKELKINKVDLLDLDLRSDLDENGRTGKAYAYGTTWFTILSPRIQSYTIGIDPVFPRQFGDGKEQTVAFVSWLGRPEDGGPGAAGRMRSQGLFSRTYEYVTAHPAKEGEVGPARVAGGLKNVMIPVWSTKSFTASWKAPLKRLPFEANLVYDREDRERPLEGTVKNSLGVDLEEVRLLYGNKWYPLPNCGQGQSLKVNFRGEAAVVQAMGANSWAQQVGVNVLDADPKAMMPTGLYDPIKELRKLLFHEWCDQTPLWRNNAQRRLDQSWRVTADWREREVVTGEAVLVGRLRRVRDAAETLTAEGNPHLPTHLWLGAVPGGAEERPTLRGEMVQDTYVRVFLPVAPKR